MHRTITVALGGAALTFGALVALPGVASAQEVDCTDAQVAAAYPDVCVAVPGTPIGGGSAGSGGGAPTGGAASGGSTTGSGSSLPFTGDEVLVLSLTGAGALAAGTALAVAGRRRSPSV